MRRPSFQLLISAVRANFDADAPVIDLQPDWDELVVLARRHRVEALAWRGIGLLGYRAPVDLKQNAQAAIARQLQSISEHQRIRDAMALHGVSHRFIKGAPLAALAWPEPQLKTSGDIDLLIGPADLNEARQAMRELGYRVEQPSNDIELARWHRIRKESVWVHANHGAFVDLHTRLVDNPRLDQYLGISSRHQDVEIVPGMSVATLPLDDTYPYLCVHGASSAWFRLKWIADLAALIHRQPGGTIERWHAEAMQRSVGHASFQALRLCNEYFGTTLPKDFRQPSLRNHMLGRIARHQLEAGTEPTRRFAGTLPIRLSQALLFDNVGTAIGEMGRQLREIAGRP